MAAFEKVLEAGRSRKYFTQRIERDLFGHWSICIEKGRIGESQRSVSRAFENERLAHEEFLRLARERFIHGYNLVAHEVPAPIEMLLLEMRDHAGRSGDGPRELDFALYEALRRLVELLPSNAETLDDMPYLKRLLAELDPQLRETSGQVRRDCAQPGLFALRDDVGEDSRRRTLRFLADLLLRDDPWARSGVARALSVPRRIDAGQVSFLEARSQSPSLHRLQVSEICDVAPELGPLADRLIDDGIEDLHALLAVGEDVLIERFRCSDRELRALETALGNRGLRLGSLVPQRRNPRQGAYSTLC